VTRRVTHSPGRSWADAPPPTPHATAADEDQQRRQASDHGENSRRLTNQSPSAVSPAFIRNASLAMKIHQAIARIASPPSVNQTIV
jgi:hypothetical protein